MNKPNEVPLLLKKTWMVSNKIFVFPDGQTALKTEKSEHTLGAPSARMDLLRRRWIDSITTIISHTLRSLIPIEADFSEISTSNLWFSRIVDMYSSDHRHYHTLCHLEEMFGYIDECTNTFCCRIPRKEMAIINMAVFFHDLVYNPKSSTNEEDSADLFQQFQRELFCDSFMQTIQRTSSIIDMNSEIPKWNGSDLVIQFILATKSHNVPTTIENEDSYFFLNLFLDADMSVLGKDDNSYDVYSSLIREEYQFVPKIEYCEKRSQVLKMFLSQPIFKTDLIRDALEEKAQSNLRREVESLQKGILLF